MKKNTCIEQIRLLMKYSKITELLNEHQLKVWAKYVYLENYMLEKRSFKILSKKLIDKLKS